VGNDRKLERPAAAPEPRPIDDRFAAVADELAEPAPKPAPKEKRVKKVAREQLAPAQGRYLPGVADYVAVLVYAKILEACPIQSNTSLRYSVLQACMRAAVEFNVALPKLTAKDIRGASAKLRDELEDLKSTLGVEGDSYGDEYDDDDDDDGPFADDYADDDDAVLDPRLEPGWKEYDLRTGKRETQQRELAYEKIVAGSYGKKTKKCGMKIVDYTLAFKYCCLPRGHAGPHKS
jgi:hypothetical protein